ncbi:unnamed protein product [Pseudo-nitzschia multistriata]|uniref:Uncharacterized protein n=1 Tax=Pseudo-nitzschia multistriata TaxID=183589 RepID=A0A448Z783_9STRA|nr:unnamed protein product [Pseudo-nitzschia multistriata]
MEESGFDDIYILVFQKFWCDWMCRNLGERDVLAASNLASLVVAECVDPASLSFHHECVRKAQGSTLHDNVWQRFDKWKWQIGWMLFDSGAFCSALQVFVPTPQEQSAVLCEQCRMTPTSKN